MQERELLPRVEAGENKFGFTHCPLCGAAPEGSHHFYFRDPLSAKEYGISGMCQSCQDNVFGRD